MDYKFIQYNLQDRILTIVLNRPERLNAVNDEMTNEMNVAFDQADRDDQVRVIIVTGAGRAFCAGADLSKMGGVTWAYHSEKIEDEERKRMKNGIKLWLLNSLRLKLLVGLGR